jgi:hypothetical protein
MYDKSPRHLKKLDREEGEKSRGQERQQDNGIQSMCVEYGPTTVHDMTLYNHSLLNAIRAFPSEGRKTLVRRYCNLARVLMRTLLRAPPGTYMYAHYI